MCKFFEYKIICNLRTWRMFKFNIQILDGLKYDSDFEIHKA